MRFFCRTVFFLFFLYFLEIGRLAADITFPILSLQTDQTITESDAIVQSSFILEPTLSGSKDSFLDPLNGVIDCMVYTIPFQIESNLKGSADHMIKVKLFYPTDPRISIHCLVALKEKLLLFLKKDPNGSTFSMVNPWGSWLIITGAQPPGSEPVDPSKAVLEDVKGFLTFYSAHPETKFEYPYAPNSPNLGALTFQPDPGLVRALQVGQNLGSTDKDFLEIAQKFENEPGEVGITAREIIASAGSVQDALQRLKNYEEGKLQGLDKLNLPAELSAAIESSKNLERMMPLISEALASPDPKVRSYVAGALRQNRSKTNQLYPTLIKMLDDPDQEVQDAAMGCIFDMSSEIKKQYGTREIELPAYKLFQKNPGFYIAQYKAWWEKHKDSLQ